jgi:aerobic carbon-monoxide dehydrogenase small subunit
LSVQVTFAVNDEMVHLDIEPRLTLLDVVRDDLGLTGTHAGCEQGACGACSVLMNGEVVRACLVLAVAADGAEVTTVEHFGTPDHLHPVQQAIWRHHGVQCGFCTPGMVMSAIDLLARIASPTEHEVREALSGNLCRCTGYSGIVAAIVEVGQQADARGAGAAGARAVGAGANAREAGTAGP